MTRNSKPNKQKKRARAAAPPESISSEDPEEFWAAEEEADSNDAENDDEFEKRSVCDLPLCDGQPRLRWLKCHKVCGSKSRSITYFVKRFGKRK